MTNNNRIIVTIILTGVVMTAALAVILDKPLPVYQVNTAPAPPEVMEKTEMAKFDDSYNTSQASAPIIDWTEPDSATDVNVADTTEETSSHAGTESLSSQQHAENGTQDQNPEERIRQQDLNQQQQLQKLEARFLQEDDYDAGWSAQHEVKISDAFSREEWQQSSLIGAQCKSTVCRVDVLHNDSESEQRFMAGLSGSEAFADTTGMFQRTENPDGTTSVTLYVARPGQSLFNDELSGPE